MLVHQVNIPRQEDLLRLPHLEHLEITEIDSGVDLLIGTNVPRALEPWEVVHGVNSGPYAVKTMLGWTVNGPLRRDRNTASGGSVEVQSAPLPGEVENRKPGSLQGSGSHPGAGCLVVKEPTEKEQDSKDSNVEKVASVTMELEGDWSANPDVSGKLEDPDSRLLCQRMQPRLRFTRAWLCASFVTLLNQSQGS